MSEIAEEGHRIGHRIRKLRELKNFTQEYIADKLDMSVSGYSRIERDEVKVSTDKLVKIAEILGISVEDLLKFNEGFIFQNFGSATGHSFSKNIFQNDIEILEHLYRTQIDTLKEEIAHLREVVLNLTGKK